MFYYICSFAGGEIRSAGKESVRQGRRPQFDSWVRKIPRRRDRLPTPVFLGFAGGSDGKESAFNARDLGSILGLGRAPGNLLQGQGRCPGGEHATHTSILARRTPWPEEPGRLQSTGSQSRTRLKQLNNKNNNL